jgi:hypothetical protein
LTLCAEKLAPRVTTVTPNDDFTLTVAFDNGETRRFDMRPDLEMGVFRQLKDMARFKAAHVAYGTVVWPGDLDIAPETLYIESVAA